MEIKPAISQLVVVQSCIADTAFTYDGVFSRALVGTVKCRSDHRVLLVRNLRRGSFPHMIESCEIWSNRHVIPRHKPKTGNIDSHAVVPQPAFVPGWIVRLALNHCTARIDRHSIRKYSTRSTRGFHNVLYRQMP